MTSVRGSEPSPKVELEIINPEDTGTYITICILVLTSKPLTYDIPQQPLAPKDWIWKFSLNWILSPVTHGTPISSPPTQRPSKNNPPIHHAPKRREEEQKRIKKYEIKNRDKTRDTTVDIAQNSNRGRSIKSSAGRKKQEEKHHARRKLPREKPAYPQVQGEMG